MIWAISGSRNGSAALVPVLERGLVEWGRPDLVVLGCNERTTASVDLVARQWCDARGIQRAVHVARWRELGKRAGNVRNGAMITTCLAASAVGHAVRAMGFPCVQSTGTWDLLAQAYTAKLDVVQYWSLRDRRLVDVPSAEFCREMADRARSRSNA